MTDSILFSVVICTYNRAQYLHMALDTLMSQKMPADSYEILVVDNNSTDNTAEIVHGYFPHLSNLRFVQERKQGLSHARNTGVAMSKGSWVIYTDDDCELPENWLEGYKAAIDMEPDIKVLGGPVLPCYPLEKPAWYKDKYATKSFGELPRVLKDGEYLIGCNFGCHRSTFAVAGYFNPIFGMTGSSIGYSEETEWQMRVRKAFPKPVIYYHPDLSVMHLMRPDKMSLKWNLFAFWAKGKSSWDVKKQLDPPPAIPSRFSLFLYFLKTSSQIVGHTIAGLLFRNRKKYTFFKNYVMERMQWHVKKLAYISQQWKS